MQLMLGQFSVIGMLRMQTLLGDYTTALEGLESIELRTNNSVTGFMICDLTINYYMAVCYVMKGRFEDALAIIPEVTAKYGNLFETDSRDKGPERGEYKVQTWFENLKKLQLLCKYMCWEDEVFNTDEVTATSPKEWIISTWKSSCPRFICPKPINLEARTNGNYVQEAQEEAFKLLIAPRFNLGNVRECLSVYRSVDVHRLGNDIGEEDYRNSLLKYKLHTRQKQKELDSLPHQGEWTCSLNSDFFIKDDFLECREVEAQNSYAEALSKLSLHITQFEKTLLAGT